MGFVMHVLDVFVGRAFIAGKNHMRLQRDNSHRELAIAIFRERADSIVNIVIDNETTFRRYVEEPQHMTAREGCDKRFFRINRRGVGHRQPDNLRRTRSGHFQSAIELPNMFSAIAMIAEGSRVSIPDDFRSVLHNLCP